MSQVLYVKLLGAPAVTWAQAPLPLPTRKSLQIICLLSLAESPLSRLELANLLWSRPRAVNLRQELSKLRKLPGTRTWLHESEGALSVACRTDLAEFTRTIHNEDYAAAVSLWRRDRDSCKRRDHLMFGFVPPERTLSFAQRLHDEREHAVALYMRALQCQAIDLEHEGNSTTAVRMYRELLGIDELNESAHQALMLLEWRRGNLAAALRQFEECRRSIAAATDMQPLPATQELSVQIRVDLLRRQRRAENVVPPHITPFLGRRREVREVQALLTNPACRAVTLLGPRGSGKSRIARRLATLCSMTFRDGAHYVPLGSVRDARRVPAVVAAAVGAAQGHGPGTPHAILDYFREREALLVFDDIEHVLGAATFLVQLKTTCPRVKVLVTSRNRPSLPNHFLFSVGGMEYPKGASDPFLERYDAVRLFVHHAERIDPTFTLTTADSRNLVQALRCVGGNPLAIELSAAWLRGMSLDAIADALTNGADQVGTREDELSDPDAILSLVFNVATSILSPRLTRIFEQLSLFDEGFSPEAAKTVTGAHLLDLVQLVDYSFLAWNGVHFTSLEALRPLASDRLRTDAPAYQAARDRHARFESRASAETCPESSRSCMESRVGFPW